MSDQLELFVTPYTIREDPDAPCFDCGTPTGRGDETNEWYMVHDRVWQAAGMGRDGFLCIGCLEARLGRRLWREDFTSAPVNDPDPSYWHSGRLFARLLVPRSCVHGRR